MWCQQNFVFNHSEVFKTGNEIILKPGFEAVAGSEVEIRILPCNDGTIQKSSTENNSEEVFGNAENRILYEIDKEINFSTETDEIINPALFSVFPNPTTDDFSLAYTLEENSFVQIDLYSISGSHIKYFLQLPQQEAGVYYYNFSLSGLSTGLYMLVFKNSTKTISNKIIKH